MEDFIGPYKACSPLLMAYHFPETPVIDNVPVLYIGLLAGILEVLYPAG